MTSPSSAPKGLNNDEFTCESAVFERPETPSDMSNILNESLTSLPVNTGTGTPEKLVQAGDLLPEDDMRKVHAAMQRTFQNALPDLNI